MAAYTTASANVKKQNRRALMPSCQGNARAISKEAQKSYFRATPHNDCCAIATSVFQIAETAETVKKKFNEKFSAFC
jgi:hypothetical protein